MIVTGADDKIADVGRQSRRLHEEIPQSRFLALPGLGQMVHHLTPDRVMKAVEQAAYLADEGSRSTPPPVKDSGI